MRKILSYLIVFYIGYLCCSLTHDVEQSPIGNEVAVMGTWVYYLRDSLDNGEANGYFIEQYNMIICETESACIHEVGHWVDKDLNYPSKEILFQEELDNYIENCNEDDYYCNFSTFPGIGSNPLTDNGWGGYAEAYAEMYAITNYNNYELPDNFVEFYK